MGGATATGRGHVTVQRIVPIAAERAFRQSCRRDGRERELPDNPVDVCRILRGYGPYRGHNPRKNVRDAGSRRGEFPGCNASSHARAPLN